MLFAFVANTKLSNYFVCMLCTPNDPHIKYSNIEYFLANKCISCRIYMKHEGREKNTSLVSIS